MGAQGQMHGRQAIGPKRRAGPLAWSMAVILIFMVAEVVGAWITGSLALLADAAHSASDVGALGLALAAVWLVRRPGPAKRTYGYFRAEVLAALANGMLLWAVAGYIFWEAGHRLASPPEVQGGGVILVASLGLTANIVAGLLLVRFSRESINTRGALLHVMSDAIASVGVIIAGILMLTLGWFLADPIISIVIGIIIIVGSFRLMRDAMSVLMESAPRNLDVAEMRQAIEAYSMVLQVHDIHCWSITPGYDAMSAHVVLTPDCSQIQGRELLESLRRMLAERFGVSHMTVQLEGEDADCIEEVHLPEAAEATKRP